MLGHALVATEDPKNFDEAKQVLKAAVNRDNEDPFAWYQLGIIYDREGDQARAALATAERNNLEGNPKLALANAEMAMKGIPAGTPDWLRAQDIAMVSRAELAKKDKKYRDDERPVSEATSALVGPFGRGGRRRRRSASLLTAGAAVLRRARTCSAAGSSAQGLLADPEDPGRRRRCASRRAICAGPRRQPRGARNAVRELVEGRRQARRHAGRILRLRLPLLQGEQPARRPAAAGG